MEKTPVQIIIAHLQSYGFPVTNGDANYWYKLERDLVRDAYSNGWHDGQDVIINQVKHVDAGGDAAGVEYYNSLT